MQRLLVELVKPEMTAAVDVVDPAGRTLIRAGQPLKEIHVRAITDYGYGSVYVNLEPFSTAPPETILGVGMQKDALKLLAQLYESFRSKTEIDSAPLRDFASRLVDQVVLNRNKPFQLVDLRTHGEYLPAHVLNVAVLALLIGIKMGYTPGKLHELAIGALVMDIGEMELPGELLHKKDKLSTEEMVEVKKHPELGFDGLRKKMKGLPTPAVHVAYQHHENFNGSGYPRGVSGSEIHEYARVVAVADMFDALVSDRPFRHYYLNHEAASILQAFAGKFLDPALVPLLLSQVALYPCGTIVQIDTGEIAEVESLSPENLNRPKLHLLTDAWGNRLKDLNSLDLAKQKSRYINKVLKDQEIIEWVDK